MGKRFQWLGLSLAVILSAEAHGQTLAPGDQPGRIEQRFVQPVMPKAKVAIRQGLESTVPPDQAAKIFLKVKGIRFEGNTALGNAELRRLTVSVIGKRVSLKNVFDIAAAITAKYGNSGYTLSRATVPPQELDPKGAIITIRIVEGYVDRVVWPEGLTRYRNFFDSYSAKITAERPIRVQTMERYLLLANDLPGLKFSSSLTPSKTNPGASTLVVTLQSEKRVSASLGLDNRGTQASGPFEVQTSVDLENIIGVHDDIKLGYTAAGPQANSSNPELHYLSAEYSQVLNSEGLKLDVSGNASWGAPGTTDLLLLDYRTHAYNISTALSFPFMRTRDTNFSGTLAFDWKNATSSILGAPQNDDHLRIIRGEFVFDHADSAHGVTQVVLSVSQGINGFGSSQNGDPLLSRSNGRVDFTKASLQLSRTQDIGHQFSAFVIGQGQIAATPLLSSEECGYGGASIGRGFEPSIFSGQDCVLGIFELRYDALAERYGLEKLQPYLFADYGAMWNSNVAVGTPTHDEGASVGVGLRAGWKNFSADLQGTYAVLKPTSITAVNTVGLFFDLTARF